jgi:Heterokaryon incompatibility protein (HET)
MDHFLLPEKPSSPVIRVPHLGRQWYDGGPFLSYGRRSGFIKDSSISDEHVSFEWLLRARNNGMSKEEFQGFLQTWLIFGMLVEFGAHSQYRNSLQSVNGLDPKAEDEIHRLLVQDFYTTWLVKDEDGQEYINSSQLVSVLQTFGEWPGTDETRRVTCSHLSHCLQFSNVVITTVRQDLDHSIAYSIVAVHEALAGTVEKSSWTYFGKLSEPLHLGWGFLGFFNEEVVESMISNGWCKSDIARIVDRYCSLHLYHFMSKLAKPNTRQSHVNCSEDRCVAHQIVAADYKPSHWPPECDCESIVVQNGDTIPILKQEDRIPLLKIGIGDSVNDTTLEVIGSTPETQYIAISHVWSDGMGNPYMTALPKCQLARLKGYAQSLKDPRFGLGNANDTEVLIWLDTLCCPVQPLKAKKLALHKMRKTYQEATLVLVVDNSLTCYKVDNPIEAACRILTSPHERRLWTLQEIALPKALCWQFSNISIGARELYETLLVVMQNPLFRGFGHDLVMDTIKHQKFLLSPRANGDKYLILSDLESALAFRGVSYPADEALCLGTLLSLPEKDILDAEEEHRMQKVWELFAKEYKGFPASLVFFRRPTQGSSSWAPSAMLALLQRQKPGIAGKVGRFSIWQGSGLATPIDLIFFRRPKRENRPWIWAPSTMLSLPQRSRPGVAGHG